MASVYKVVTDHMLVTQQEQSITVDSLCIGIQLRVLASSGEPDLTYGLNEPAGKVPLNVNDLPASYGGFNVNGIPAIYEGLLNIKFASANSPRALVILTRLVPQPVPGLQVC